jgi:hypothetical protein
LGGGFYGISCTCIDQYIFLSTIFCYSTINETQPVDAKRLTNLREAILTIKTPDDGCRQVKAKLGTNPCGDADDYQEGNDI